MLVNIAKQQVGDWLLARLEKECPGGKATKTSITTCVASACRDLGFGDETIKVKIEDGRAVFIVDSLSAMMMAAKIGAPNG